MNVQYICFPNYDKLKSFVETFTPNNQILIFEEQYFMHVQYEFLYLLLTMSKLTVQFRQPHMKEYKSVQ